MAEQHDTAREYYLKQFKAENKPNGLFIRRNKIGERIVELLKKEDLTHEQAYESLQYAYNLIKYESNFLKLG